MLVNSVEFERDIIFTSPRRIHCLQVSLNTLKFVRNRQKSDDFEQEVRFVTRCRSWQQQDGGLRQAEIFHTFQLYFRVIGRLRVPFLGLTRKSIIIHMLRYQRLQKSTPGLGIMMTFSLVAFPTISPDLFIVYCC